jgi:hypothetical protein
VLASCRARAWTSKGSTAGAIGKHAAQLFAWAKLLICRVKPLRMSDSLEVSPESTRDIVARPIQKSKTKARMAVLNGPHVESGRDYHTMHYIPTQEK